MSLFRKTPQPVAAVTPPDAQEYIPPEPIPVPSSVSSEERLFNGAAVDIDAIYRAAKLSSEERDRVGRAEELLHLLPSSASQTREVVDATLRAFGVDGTKIVEAASKQLRALEAFIRFSHEQTQRVLDAGARRIG